jgi:flagellar basal body-associated protein FliL
MRIFVLLASAVVVVVIGYVAGLAYFTRSHPVSTVAAVSTTMSPHDIHLNYKAMDKLPVHDVKDAF